MCTHECSAFLWKKEKYCKSIHSNSNTDLVNVCNNRTTVSLKKNKIKKSLKKSLENAHTNMHVKPGGSYKVYLYLISKSH